MQKTKQKQAEVQTYRHCSAKILYQPREHPKRATSDDTKNGCVADYLCKEISEETLVEARQDGIKKNQISKDCNFDERDIYFRFSLVSRREAKLGKRD